MRKGKGFAKKVQWTHREYRTGARQGEGDRAQPGADWHSATRPRQPSVLSARLHCHCENVGRALPRLR